VQHCVDTYKIIDAAECIQSFTDTAKLVEAMDLVISIDTAVAHLAGAMHKPVLNLLPFAADWRWQINREDSPWYPSMRLLRQTAYRDWSNVTARLTQLLPKIRDRFQQRGEIELTL
jgi:ADP-heptose:LPS heptosyltransferase